MVPAAGSEKTANNRHHSSPQLRTTATIDAPANPPSTPKQQQPQKNRHKIRKTGAAADKEQPSSWLSAAKQLVKQSTAKLRGNNKDSQRHFPGDLSPDAAGKSAGESATDSGNGGKSGRKGGFSGTSSVPHTSWTSPTNGTDILTHPIALIKCSNQTRCIQPKLQLQRTYDAYMCKHIGQGVRWFFLVKEGLLLHPNIRLTSNPQDAEVVVFLPVSAPWEQSECNKPEFKEKTIILDEGDYPQLFERPGPKDWLLYFKRSYVRRQNGAFQGYMEYLNNPAILPMTYPVAEAYVRPTFNMMRGRDLDIVCTLRGSSTFDPTRQRVRQWVGEYAKARGVTRFVAGQVNYLSRTVVSTDYLGQMFRAKIIVTSNPSDWEGDFRLMEAFASGALIFVDRMYVPRPSPLLHGKHVVYYDNHNKTDFFEKLDFYRNKQEASRRVAVAGYLHAMKYHRAPNFIDFVFRTLETKKAILSYLGGGSGGGGRGVAIPVDLGAVLSRLRASGRQPLYTETGYHTRQQALDMHRGGANTESIMRPR